MEQEINQQNKPEISPCLREAGLIRVRKSTKQATYKSGTKPKDHLTNFEKLKGQVPENCNVGLVCGINDFFSFECDSFELSQAVEQILPKTYCEESISQYEGFIGKHFVFKMKNVEQLPNIKVKDSKKEYGDIKTNNGYILIAPSQAYNKQGRLGQYKTIQEVERVPYITKEQVQEVISQFMSNPENKTEGNYQELEPETLEIIQKDSDLNKLFEGDINDFNSRSEAEQSLTNKLRARNFDKETSLKVLMASGIGKIREKPISYWELMWENALNYVTTAKKEYLKTKNKQPLKLMTIRDYEAYKPDKNYIIENIIQPKENSMVVGASGCGKSLNMLYQAICIASGRKYLKKYKVKKNPVLVVSAENSIEVDKDRIEKIRKGLRIRKKDLPLYFLPRSECQDILGIGFQAALAETIEKYNIKVVFLDTINPLTPELDDNKAQDVTKVFNNFIKPFCDNYGVHICFLHHTGKTGNSYLGSVKWKANVDNVFRLDRKGLSSKVKMFNEKNRKGEIPRLDIGMEFNEKNIKFNLISEGESPELYSKKKKMSQKEFFEMKLKELDIPKDASRQDVYKILKEHKVKFKLDNSGKNSTLERAIKNWRDKE